jgi:hypothetical protein
MLDQWRPDPCTTQEKAEEKVRYEVTKACVQTPPQHQEKAESEKVRYEGLGAARPDLYHTREGREREGEGGPARPDLTTHKRRQRARR